VPGHNPGLLGCARAARAPRGPTSARALKNPKKRRVVLAIYQDRAKNHVDYVDI
jgi:hypothetical protein